LLWRRIRADDTVGEAAACLGISETCGRLWFRMAGGMSPVSAKYDGQNSRQRFNVACQRLARSDPKSQSPRDPITDRRSTLRLTLHTSLDR